MLKTKDKRLICLIILSVSIVSLLTTLISGFISGLAQFIDAVENRSEWVVWISAFSFAYVVIFISFPCVFFFNKKRTDFANIITLSVNAVIFIVCSVILCCCDTGVDFEDYAVYLAISLTLIVSAMFMTATKWLLTKFKDEEIATEESKQE